MQAANFRLAGITAMCKLIPLSTHPDEGRKEPLQVIDE
jgi:hypothetical protein